MVIATAVIKAIPLQSNVRESLKESLLNIRHKTLKDSPVRKHGMRWRCQLHLEDIDSGTISNVRLLDQFHEEVSKYTLHPAIFDRSIHTTTEHLIGISLPYTCESIRIFGQCPAQTLSHGQLTTHEGISTTNFTILDIEGNLVAEIEGYAQRPFQDDMMSEWGLSKSSLESGGYLQMQIETPGDLDSFRFQSQTLPALGADEIRIEPRAAGLSWWAPSRPRQP